jgi:hypothetical protein
MGRIVEASSGRNIEVIDGRRRRLFSQQFASFVKTNLSFVNVGWRLQIHSFQQQNLRSFKAG